MARRIGETRTVGIPLVAGVSVTNYEQGRVGGICSPCEVRLFARQFVAWVIAWIPIAIVAGVAAALQNEVVAFVAGIGAIVTLRSMFHTWADRMVWSDATVAKLGLPKAFYIPVGIGQVLARGLGLPIAGLVALGLVARFVTGP